MKRLIQYLRISERYESHVRGDMPRSLRNALFFRPLALAMAVLLALPAFEWITAKPGSRSAVMAQAQTFSCSDSPAFCPPAATRILQDMNAPGLFSQQQILLGQWEPIIVQTYLAIHGLPASDAALIYQYGDANLRNDVRGFMRDALISIILEKAELRTPVEAAVYSWLSLKAQAEEKAYYTAVNNDFQNWKKDPCHYSLDPDVQAVQNLNYNQYEFCGPNLTGLLATALVPTLDYFLAVGWKNSYGQLLGQNHAVLTGMQSQASQFPAQMIAYPSGLLVAIGAGATAMNTFQLVHPFFEAKLLELNSPTGGPSALIPAEDTQYVGAEAAEETADVVADAAPEAEAALIDVEGVVAAGTAASAIGVAAIVLFGIEAAVEAGLSAVQNQQNLDAINTIPTLQQNAGSADLLAMAQKQEGITKIDTLFAAATLPDFPSTAGLGGLTLPAFKVYSLTRNGPTQTVAGDFIAYTSATGTPRQARARGGWFVDSDSSGKATLTPTLHYVDWLGIERYGSRISPSLFLVSKAQLTGNEIACPGIPVNQFKTPNPDLQNCISYVTDNLLLSGNGQGPDQSVQIVVPRTITSPGYVDYTPGVSKTFTITLSDPVNSVPCFIQRSKGPLAAGLTFSAATQTFGGTAAAGTTGVYPQTFRMFCGNVEFPAYTFQVVVGGSALTITSPPGFAIYQFKCNNILFTTTGFPTPKLSLSGYEAPTYAPFFHDNGNGTATLSGNPGAPPFVFGGGPPLVLTASNGVQTVTQALTDIYSLGGGSDSQVALNPQNGASLHFSINKASAYTISSLGANAPVTLLASTPSWLTFKNKGDGTGLLSGTPPLSLGATTATSTVVGKTACGQFVSDTYQIKVDVPAPDFVPTSPPLSFLVGSPTGTNPPVLQTNQLSGTMTPKAPLPFGLSLDPNVFAPCFPPAPCGGFLNAVEGTPGPGSGGLYQVPFDIRGNWGESTVTARLLVYQPPKIQGNGRLIFNAGVPATLSVAATGYPLSPLGSSANGLGSSNGVIFTLDHPDLLPPFLQFTSGLGGIANGTASFKSSATTANYGTYLLPLTATITTSPVTGYTGPTALADHKELTIYVVPPGDVNLDFTVNCQDLATIKAALGTSSAVRGFNPDLDVNHDGAVNIKDLAWVAQHLPAGTACQ